MFMKWDEQIAKLGDQGIKEAKPVIISCVHWMLSNFGHSLNLFEVPEALEALIQLVKKLYCIERAFEFD
jgi:hypothetical protein